MFTAGLLIGKYFLEFSNPLNWGDIRSWREKKSCEELELQSWFKMFQWPHEFCSGWKSSTLSLLFIWKSLSQWHKVDFVLLTADATAYVTFRSIEQSVQSRFQETGNGFQGARQWDSAPLLSLGLGGYTRTSGWPAEPAHHPSWTEHRSLPSASVSLTPSSPSLSVSLQEHAASKYIILWALSPSESISFTFSPPFVTEVLRVQ